MGRGARTGRRRTGAYDMVIRRGRRLVQLRHITSPSVRLTASATMMAICIFLLEKSRKYKRGQALRKGPLHEIAEVRRGDSREDGAAGRVDLPARAEERVRLGVLEEEERQQREEEGDGEAVEQRAVRRCGLGVGCACEEAGGASAMSRRTTGSRPHRTHRWLSSMCRRSRTPRAPGWPRRLRGARRRSIVSSGRHGGLVGQAEPRTLDVDVPRAVELPAHRPDIVLRQAGGSAQEVEASKRRGIGNLCARAVCGVSASSTTERPTRASTTHRLGRLGLVLSLGHLEPDRALQPDDVVGAILVRRPRTRRRRVERARPLALLRQVRDERERRREDPTEVDQAQVTAGEGRAACADLASGSRGPRCNGSRPPPAVGPGEREGRELRRASRTHLPLEVSNAVGLLGPQLEVPRAIALVGVRPDRWLVDGGGDDAALGEPHHHAPALAPLRPCALPPRQRRLALLALGLVRLGDSLQALRLTPGEGAKVDRARRGRRSCRVVVVGRRRRLRQGEQWLDC